MYFASDSFSLDCGVLSELIPNELYIGSAFKNFYLACSFCVYVGLSFCPYNPAKFVEFTLSFNEYMQSPVHKNKSKLAFLTIRGEILVAYGLEMSFQSILQVLYIQNRTAILPQRPEIEPPKGSKNGKINRFSTIFWRQLLWS